MLASNTTTTVLWSGFFFSKGAHIQQSVFDWAATNVVYSIYGYIRKVQSPMELFLPPQLLLL